LSRRVDLIRRMTNITSPCVGICQYDEEEICQGCLRTSGEIIQWTAMSEEERLSVIENLNKRAELLG